MPSARVGRPTRKSAAITGFTSAIAAFGAFFIPKAYGTSIALTGGPEAALWAFLLFYVGCLAHHLGSLHPQGRPPARHRAGKEIWTINQHVCRRLIRGKEQCRIFSTG